MNEDTVCLMIWVGKAVQVLDEVVLTRKLISHERVTKEETPQGLQVESAQESIK